MEKSARADCVGTKRSGSLEWNKRPLIMTMSKEGWKMCLSKVVRSTLVRCQGQLSSGCFLGAKALPPAGSLCRQPERADPGPDTRWLYAALKDRWGGSPDPLEVRCRVEMRGGHSGSSAVEMEVRGSGLEERRGL